jgi:hypothetical protein
VAVAAREVDLVARPHPLGLVHRDVGALEQPERVAGVLGEGRDADAGVDVDPDAAHLEGALQRRPQPEARGAGRRLVARRQHDCELVAAQARERVLVTQQRAEAGPDLAQHLVPRVMSERVVELLEAVEVHEQQGELAAALAA